ncbi:MAG TPA: hypothetical protein PK899_01715 [Spirochaetota bacterium]|nr:hypothetical protein [Spirochaetota bacterium]
MKISKIYTVFFLFLLNFHLFPEYKITGNLFSLFVDGETSKFILYGRNKIEDKMSPLLAEDFPPSTYFKFYINKILVPFGEGGKGRKSEISKVGNDLHYFWSNDVIKIVIKYTLLSSIDKKPADTLLLRMNAENISNNKYSVGILFCVDTLLGESKRKHFLLDGSTLLNKEAEYIKNIPFTYINSYSETLKMGINILFDERYIDKPDRIYFTNWKKGSTNEKYKVKPGADFDLKPYSLNDSAVFIEYENITVNSASSIDKNFILSKNSSVDIDERYLKPKKSKKTVGTSTTTTVFEEPTTTTTTTYASITTTTIPAPTTTTYASTSTSTTSSTTSTYVSITTTSTTIPATTTTTYALTSTSTSTSTTSTTTYVSITTTTTIPAPTTTTYASTSTSTTTSTTSTTTYVSTTTTTTTIPTTTTTIPAPTTTIPVTTTTYALITTTTSTIPLKYTKIKAVNLINMEIDELLSLLDEINKNLAPGYAITQEDLDSKELILNEILKRQDK